MKFLTKEEILGQREIRVEPLAVPEWGKDCGVYILAMTGRERDAFEAERLAKKTKDERKNLENFRASFSSRVICDENGKLLFSEADVLALGEKRAAALDRIVDKGMSLAGMSRNDQDELVKNSEGGQSEDSISG